MRVQLLLADSAQVVGGKLYLLGGMWSEIGPAPTPMAVVVRFVVPWDQTNLKHKWSLRLLDQDGEAVGAESGAGPKPIVVGGEFEAGRPAGARPGTEISIPVAVNMGALRLPPGRRLEWRLYVDGETEDDWREVFSTRPAASG
jgi:hypothetical protein